MSDEQQPQHQPSADPLLWAARRERAKRWLNTDLRGYPTLSAEEETEETLAAEPKEQQVKKGKPKQED